MIPENNDISIFGILAGHSWPRLKTIMFNLKVIPRQESREEAWLASIELLRAVTSETCPSFERVCLSIGHDAYGYRPPDEVLFGVEGVFLELEEILVELEDGGRFETLAISIWAEQSDASDSEWPPELHDAQYDPFLQMLLPRLHERGMLVLRDFTKEYTDGIMKGAV